MNLYSLFNIYYDSPPSSTLSIFYKYILWLHDFITLLCHDIWLNI